MNDQSGCRTYSEDELLGCLQSVSRTRLRTWLREGVVRPRRQGGHAVYDDTDRARLELVAMLSNDFDVQDDALSIFVTYVDQVHTLRRDMLRLVRAIERQPMTVRQAIIDVCRQDDPAAD